MLDVGTGSVAGALRYPPAFSRNRSASRFDLSRRVFQPRLAAALRFLRTRSMSCTSFSAVRWAPTPGVLHLA